MSLASRIADFEAVLGMEEAQSILEDKPSIHYEWPPLPDRLGAKPFPLTALPPVGRDMVEAIAEHVQSPIDMGACFVLGALSTCIVGRGQVEISPGYVEPLQLYIVVAANPSERKSPAMSPAFAPIYEYVTQKNRDIAPIIRDNAALASMKKRLLAKSADKMDEAKVLNLTREIEKLESVRPFVLTITDGSPEAIIGQMAQNNGRIAIVSAEGALLDVLGGMYSDKGVNLDVILQGYTGEAIRSVRVSRQTPPIDKAALSITLAAQPMAIEKLLSNETLTGRGVVSRFLLSNPPSMLGKRDPRKSCPIPEHIKHRYKERLTTILNRGETTLTLSPEAKETFMSWQQSVEMKLTPGAELDRLPAGWGGKLCGNTARIAGLLCLLEGQNDSISGITMQAAVSIAEYFVNQMTILSNADISLSSDATEVLRFIIRWNRAEYKPADLRQALRGRVRFNSGNKVTNATNELIREGYIRQVHVEAKPGAGRPPEALHQVHPDLLKPQGRGGVFEI
jgi:replicative DNA helicase